MSVPQSYPHLHLYRAFSHGVCGANWQCEDTGLPSTTNIRSSGCGVVSDHSWKCKWFHSFIPHICTSTFSTLYVNSANQLVWLFWQDPQESGETILHTEYTKHDNPNTIVNTFGLSFKTQNGRTYYLVPYHGQKRMGVSSSAQYPFFVRETGAGGVHPWIWWLELQTNIAESLRDKD